MGGLKTYNVTPSGFLDGFYSIFYNHVTPSGFLDGFYSVFYNHVTPLGFGLF
jgi:hypothetical protein